MPKINQTTQIDVTPEKFLNACSETELIETMMLLSSAKYDSVFDRNTPVISTCQHNWDEGFNNVSKCKKCGKYSA